MYSDVLILINGKILLDDLKLQWPLWQTFSVKNNRLKKIIIDLRGAVEEREDKNTKQSVEGFFD